MREYEVPNEIEHELRRLQGSVREGERREAAMQARVREMEAERHAMVRVFLDGNSWCALVGPDLQEGVAGFGVTPAHALTDLAENLMGNPWPEDHAARQAVEVENA